MRNVGETVVSTRVEEKLHRGDGGRRVKRRRGEAV